MTRARRHVLRWVAVWAALTVGLWLGLWLSAGFAVAAPSPEPSPTGVARPGSGQAVPGPSPTQAPAAPTQAPTQAPSATAAPTDPGGTPATVAPTPSQSSTPATGAPTMPARPGSGFSGQNPAPGPGILENLCRKAPEPEAPGKTALDVIDFGRASGDGLYARYRYAGWKSHLLNPGCADAAIYELAKMQGGTIGLAGQAVTEEGGPNKTTNIILSSTLFGIALTVAATRLAFGEYPVWGVADQVADAARATFGGAVLWAFLSVGVVASLLWLATRRRMGWAAMGGYLWRIAGITLLGAVLIGWNGSVGQSYDSMVAGANRAATAAVTGVDSDEQAGDVVGDALMEDVYLPLWGAVHLGWDQDAIAKYANRLHAASAFTVDEAARTAGNRDAFNQLAKAKQGDYEKVADEVARTHPTAYAQLEGKDAGDRVMFAVILALAVLSILVVVGVTAVAILAARIIVRVGAGVYPVMVAALQFPSLQRWGVGIPRAVLRWAVIGVVATVVSVVLHRVLIVAALTEGEGSVWQRIAALTGINITLIIGWVFRDKLAAKAGINREVDVMTDALNRLGDRFEKLIDKPAEQARGAFREFRHGGRHGPLSHGDLPNGGGPEKAQREPGPQVGGPDAPAAGVPRRGRPDPKGPVSPSGSTGPGRGPVSAMRTRPLVKAAVNVAPPQARVGARAAARVARPARVVSKVGGRR